MLETEKKTKKSENPSVSANDVPKKRMNWVVWITLTVVIITVTIGIVTQLIQISNAREELQRLKDKANLEQIKIDELRDVAEAVEKEDFDKFDDYIEKKAREYGFTKDGEVVFINIAGN